MPLVLDASVTLSWAFEEGQLLTSYDASYLELAMRHNLPLATEDDRLRRAAQAVGVSVLQPADEDHGDEPED